jgi:hypothetical protein
MLVEMALPKSSLIEAFKRGVVSATVLSSDVALPAFLFAAITKV